jgi:hypothetical protein
LVITKEEKDCSSFVAKTTRITFSSFFATKNTPKKFQIKQRRGKKGTFFFL